MADAEIIPFPGVVEKSCADCEWAAFSVHGTYCIQLHEDIWNESWANDCELFDPIPTRVKEK